MSAKSNVVVLLACLTGAVFGADKTGRDYRAPTPTNAVIVSTFSWTDRTRSREVPVKIYAPKTGASPLPVIVFSHGLGGTRDGYEYLGRFWAASGFISVHGQHPGSDDGVWKNAAVGNRLQSMSRAAAQPANSLNRPRDISFTIDQLVRLNADSTFQLHGRFDTNRIGVAGHSYGGYTALAVAGESFPAGKSKPAPFADPRIKAAVSMSAPVPRREQDYAAAFASIYIPVFHLTGTEDNSPIGDTKAADRRAAFDHMTGAETCLLIFNGGDHMVFSGTPGRNQERDTLFQDLICRSTTAFWDAYLNNNSMARDWLLRGGFKTDLKAIGSFETKLPSAKTR